MSARLVKLAIDTLIAFGAFILAYDIGAVFVPSSWWFTDPAAVKFVLWALGYAALAACATLLFRLERSAWRFASLPDALAIAAVATLTAVAFLLVHFALTRADNVARTVLLLAWVLHAWGLATVRLCVRGALEGRLGLPAPWGAKPKSGDEAQRVVLVGDPRKAEAFMRELESGLCGQPRQAAAIVSPTGYLHGHNVRGVKVYGGASALATVLAKLDRREKPAGAVIFLERPAQMGYDAAALSGLSARGIALLQGGLAPPVADAAAAAAPAGARLKVLDLEDLLERPQVALDPNQLASLVVGRRVLVTGAGGSIGSEICRQVAASGCAHLTMLDLHEHSLFQIDLEISRTFPKLSRKDALADVRDRALVEGWIRSEKPDLIFHAAALKHVPMLESHPAEGVLTNVIGTRNVAEAAAANGVRAMVLISTDKAVGPMNLMGQSKRIAEILLRGMDEAALAAGGGARTRYFAVRFGNVLGSNGSVVPLFRDQIERGGPLTITHPDAERYFMTIPEAVQLVLHATALGVSRQDVASGVFVLEMGAPVRILDLAIKLIKAYGLVPNRDIAIEYVGLRPGEQVTQHLVDHDETAAPSGVSHVREVRPKAALSQISAQTLDDLERLARGRDNAAVRRRVMELLATRVRVAAA